MSPSSPGGSSRVAAIVLAAGQSTRWGRDNKLLALVGGLPMLMRTLESALGSVARPIIVVAGHEAPAIESLVSGPSVTVVLAADFAEGLAASLKTGIAAVPEDCDGALVCLGDMPFVRAETLDSLVSSFDPRGSGLALIPTYQGRRGNPVLLSQALFSRIADLSGDQGARALLSAMPERILEISVDDPGVLRDLDTPETT